MSRLIWWRAASIAACVSFLSACGTIPADSIGTLDRARTGGLVVGVSEHQPVKSDGVVFLPFVETSSVMASGTGTCLVL